MERVRESARLSRSPLIIFQSMMQRMRLSKPGGIYWTFIHERSFSSQLDAMLYLAIALDYVTTEMFLLFAFICFQWFPDRRREKRNWNDLLNDLFDWERCFRGYLVF